MQAVNTPGAPPPAFDSLRNEILQLDVMRKKVQTWFSAAKPFSSVCRNGIQITSQLAGLEVILKKLKEKVKLTESNELKELFNSTLVTQRNECTEFLSDLCLNYQLATTMNDTSNQKEMYKLGKEFIKTWNKVDMFII